jgi:hypothetical protein
VGGPAQHPPWVCGTWSAPTRMVYSTSWQRPAHAWSVQRRIGPGPVESGPGWPNPSRVWPNRGTYDGIERGRSSRRVRLDGDERRRGGGMGMTTHGSTWAAARWRRVERGRLAEQRHIYLGINNTRFLIFYCLSEFGNSLWHKIISKKYLTTERVEGSIFNKF